MIQKTKDLSVETAVDGQGLDIATVVAIARLVVDENVQKQLPADLVLRYGARAYLNDASLKKIEESAKTMHSGIETGQIVYGTLLLLRCSKMEVEDLGTDSGHC